jgi:hypothetical protein
LGAVAAGLVGGALTACRLLRLQLPTGVDSGHIQLPHAIAVRGESTL